MMKLSVGEKRYQIKFGYAATIKSGIVNRLISMENTINNNQSESITAIMELLPELLLAGLQKYHKDDFGCNYDKAESHEKALEKVTELLDDYFDEEESDFTNLFEELQKELLENGFLGKVLRMNQTMEESAEK